LPRAADFPSKKRIVVIGLVTIIGFLALSFFISPALYFNVGPRARTATAQVHVRELESAVRMYSKHTGSLPASLADLTMEAMNSKGEPAGPFAPRIPLPPSGWMPYRYEVRADGTFTITTSGEGYTVRVSRGDATVTVE